MTYNKKYGPVLYKMPEMFKCYEASYDEERSID